MMLNPSILFLLCFISFFFFFLPSLFSVCAAASFLSPLCHDKEKSALLQFKDSFIIDLRSCPKVKYWKLHLDCCSWDGVTCDGQTGHVIELDLSSSCLYGSINSSSSLFHLLHLRSLNLAQNNFNYSQIPANLGHLSELTYLNLSSSSFVGKIPSSISQLSKLSVLDLNFNENLELKNSDFHSLVKNLTSLEDLRLVFVHISSTIPSIIANLSSLKSLRLSFCGLYGEFPVGIFQLPHLQVVRVAGNSNLKGYLPEFNSSSPLGELATSYTSFSGEIPDSIGNLTSLSMLSIYHCGFSGQVPASLGNEIELEWLDIRGNNFDINNSPSLSWLSKLSRLTHLGLSNMSFNKVFPTYFANLTKLAVFTLEKCEIHSQIPSWLMNMTQLLVLHLPQNQLQGPIPELIFQLRNLKTLDLSGNNLTGTVDLGMFSNKLSRLTRFLLSGNNLSLLDNHISNDTVVKFSTLGFAGCNLNHFPNFLRHQDELEWLDLSNNFIGGKIPKRIWNTSKDTLKIVDLSHNFLQVFEEDPIQIQWSQITVIDLSSNMLQGSLPTPPPSIQVFRVDNNNLEGHVSPIICSFSSLRVLDLSYNNFTGSLPSCLSNFSTSMEFLNLGGNKFHGKIPYSYTDDCSLRMLSLDSNQLEGEVPRSLSNCGKLEFLFLGNNRINDVFPFWLGSIHELKVLILRSNRFHGEMENHNSNFSFPKLLIIDISQNNFSGKLPAQYFFNWNAMKIVGAEDELVYLKVVLFFEYEVSRLVLQRDFSYSMTITNKGIILRYFKILDSFVAIDFSSNNFEGGIPQVIGNLSGLRLLNLSNNNLNGSIPTLLGNLSKLESLDLSVNNLSGEIPQELTKLNFLSVFNVSYNHLTSPIPHGNQFDTFENSSYQRNAGLCGNPLSRKCGNSEAIPPSISSTEVVEDSNSFFQFSWRAVVMGYGCGFILGAGIGHIVVTRKFEWFLKTFRIKQGKMVKGTKRRT